MSYYRRDPFYGYFFLNTALDARDNGTQADFTLSPATIMLAKWGLDIAQNRWAWRSNGEQLTDAEWVQAETMVDTATDEFYMNSPIPPAIPDNDLKLWIAPPLGFLDQNGNPPVDLAPIVSCQDGRGSSYLTGTDGGVSSRQGRYNASENAIEFFGDDYYTIPGIDIYQPLIIAGQFLPSNNNVTKVAIASGSLSLSFWSNAKIRLYAGNGVYSTNSYSTIGKQRVVAVFDGAQSSINLNGTETQLDTGINDIRFNLYIGQGSGIFYTGLLYGVTIANYADPSYKTILEDYYAV